MHFLGNVNQQYEHLPNECYIMAGRSPQVCFISMEREILGSRICTCTLFKVFLMTLKVT